MVSFDTVGVDPAVEIDVGKGVGRRVGRGVGLGVGGEEGGGEGDAVGTHVGWQNSSQTTVPGIDGADPAQSELNSSPSAQPTVSESHFNIPLPSYSSQ